MKKATLILFLATFYLSSCSSSRMATREIDDVYYSEKDAVASDYNGKSEPNNSAYTYSESNENTGARNSENNTENNFQNNSNNDQNMTNSGANSSNDRFQDGNYSIQPSQSNTTMDEDGRTIINNYYYDTDDYYDYAYTSQIRRFNHPVGWSYYDPYYTNLYWYDYNPYSWGVSLYTTYSWWTPGFYGPCASIGFNYGWNNWYGCTNSFYGGCFGGYGGYYGGYYGGFGGGFYGGFGGGFGGYNHGYQNGYWDGYYAGLYNGSFNPYYYNSYDPYSYYYGPRGGSNPTASNVPSGGRNISDLYGKTLAADGVRSPKLVPVTSGMGAIGRPKREANTSGTITRDNLPGKPRIDTGKDGMMPNTNSPIGKDKNQGKPKIDQSDMYDFKDNGKNPKGDNTSNPKTIENPKSIKNSDGKNGDTYSNPKNSASPNPKSSQPVNPKNNNGDGYTPKSSPQNNPTPRNNGNEMPRNNTAPTPKPSQPQGGRPRSSNEDNFNPNGTKNQSNNSYSNFENQNSKTNTSGYSNPRNENEYNPPKRSNGNKQNNEYGVDRTTRENAPSESQRRSVNTNDRNSRNQNVGQPSKSTPNYERSPSNNRSSSGGSNSNRTPNSSPRSSSSRTGR